ncbi:MAG: iron-containing alcohol dehydrogenase [Firmicutes bacterium]|nr:iron-containing alcohol dehydrogenase [Bacillota bacterium]
MATFKHFGVPRIYFGPGCLKELPGLVSELSQELDIAPDSKILIVCGSHAKRGLLEELEKLLQPAELAVFVMPFGEPTLSLVEKGIEAAQDTSLVIGAGGGSALDTAKAIAGLAKLEGAPEEYFFGREIDKPSLPWIGIPTTAGSGAEATNNSVLIHKGKKQSVRSPFWFAKGALVDPNLTLSLPPQQTAASGFDALTHAVEAYCSRFSNPLSDLLSRQAIELVTKSLPGAVEDGSDLKAREDLLLGSLLAALAFVNCRLGAVHGLAHPIGVRSGASHGVTCALLLPHVFLCNLPVLGSKAQDIADIWQAASPEEVAEKIWHLLDKFGLPKTLRELGIEQEDLPDIARESLPSASLAANPQPFDFHQLVDLLEKAY